MRDAVERITRKGHSAVLRRLISRIPGVPSEYSDSDSDSDSDTPETNLIRLTSIPSISKSKVLVIKSAKDLQTRRSGIEEIQMNAGACNDPSIIEWNLSLLVELRVLCIGDNCVQFVSELKLVGFVKLETVKIGLHCFSGVSSGSFEVSGCTQLKSVNVGSGSCVNWTTFTMKDCEAVEEVVICEECFVTCEITVFESACWRAR